MVAFDRLEPPPRPMVFANGKVHLNDELAPDGFTLFARIDDYETEHQPEIKKGKYTFFKITPNEGKYIGKTIQFFLRDGDGSVLEAQETATFEDGMPPRFGFDIHASRSD